MVIYIIEIVDLPINSMVDLSSSQTVAVYQAGYISHNIHFYISLEDPRSEHGCNNQALGGCDFDKKKNARDSPVETIMSWGLCGANLFFHGHQQAHQHT